LPQIFDVSVSERFELFEIVLWVEFLFDNRLLPDDGVEEIAVFGHAPAWGRAQITLGVDQNIAIRIRGDAEFL
jgi:hypothetical protein